MTDARSQWLRNHPNPKDQEAQVSGASAGRGAVCEAARDGVLEPATGSVNGKGAGYGTITPNSSPKWRRATRPIHRGLRMAASGHALTGGSQERGRGVGQIGVWGESRLCSGRVHGGR